MEKKIYLLWFGQTISWTGSSMSFFAIGVWIYETTGKASALSTILFTVAIVGVVTGPFGGVLADRFQRKKLIIIFDLTIAVLMCIIGYLALNNILTLTLLIPFALAFGIFEIAHWTTWSAFLGDVVKKNEVTKISALFESAEAISVLIGPIGGVIGWPMLLGLSLIVSNFWAYRAGEWNGAKKPFNLLLIGLAVLIFASIILGYSNSII